MMPDQCDLFGGREDRDDALRRLEEARKTWVERARTVADIYARQMGEVCSDDIWAMCPPPVDVDPRVMGAVFAKGKWERVGYRQSKRRQCHARPIPIWRLKGEDGEDDGCDLTLGNGTET